MADPRVQTYASHAHRPRLATLAALFVLAALAFFIIEMMRFRGPLMYGALCLTAAVMMLIAISRLYIVRLQDRIIRLEMQVRLARLGLGTSFPRLSLRQLVALRFASDAELPALVSRSLAENLTDRQIKQSITDWQADWFRT